jgi:hypothetical protein
MKKLILAMSFALLSFAAFAQMEKRTDNPVVSIFPNPATEYITVSNEDVVKNIVVFNMVGRKMRTFIAEKGERYEIGDLPNGLYVVQLFGKNNKVLTTQRLTKKS